MSDLWVTIAPYVRIWMAFNVGWYLSAGDFVYASIAGLCLILWLD